MNKRGFTLAETLITLTIIGVIAGIMLPAVTRSQPNREMVMLKKAYYNVTRIVSELINDEDYYPEASNPNQSGFSHTSISAVNGGTEATYHNIVYSGNAKFCGLFAARINTTSGTSNPTTLCSSGRISLANGGNFTTSDGITWSMPFGNFNSGSDVGSEDIYIDVDGPNRGHNCTADGAVAGQLTACTGNDAPDQFIIRVGRYGGVTLPGTIAQEYVSSQNTTKKYTDFLQ